MTVSSPTALLARTTFPFRRTRYRPCVLPRRAVRPEEYKLPGVVNLHIQPGRTINEIHMDAWRVDVSCIEDRDHAERLLQNVPDVAEEDSTDAEAPAA